MSPFRGFSVCLSCSSIVLKRQNVKGRGRALDIPPQVDMATTEALRYMARTKQRRTYLPYTFPAVAGTHHAVSWVTGHENNVPIVSSGPNG